MGQHTHVDATALRQWAQRALDTASRTAAMVDSFNVFPLPDLDTGSNVLLTLRGAATTLETLPVSTDAATTARVLADGAVRAARGNSGLLVSQVLVALADAIAACPDHRGLRPVELVGAYEAAASQTWAAVSRPVTGTLLSVAKDAATAAREALLAADLTHHPTMAQVAGAAALGAQESVVETSGLGHGPVDAGGAALMLILTCLADVLEETCPTDHAGTYTPVAIQMLHDLAGAVRHVPTSGSQAGVPASTGEFEVMYLLEATTAQAGALRRRLETIGDSVGVVGTPDALGVGLFQVHVHTDTPRSALPRLGRARQVCVHHLHPTTPALTGAWDVAEPPLPPVAAAAGNVVSLERFASRRGSASISGALAFPASADPASPAAGRASHGVGVVACTRVPGLLEVLARTGAVVVLDPSPEGIIRAVGDLSAVSVLVLPCDGQAADAAHQAARYLAARSLPARVTAPGGGPVGSGPANAVGQPPQVIVADTDDDARVLAAAVALASRNPDDGVAHLAGQASLAAADVRTLALSGPQADPEAVARTVTGAVHPGDRLVTVVLGRDCLPDVGAVVAAALAAQGEEILGQDPVSPSGGQDEVEVAIHAGGQASPDVLVAIQ